MQEFIERPANLNSLSHRRLIHGAGINDAWYVVSNKINNKLVFCPFYQCWKSMITRCYSHNYQLSRPSYIDCSVVKEWLTFSNFRKWMETQDWQSKQLDKDILIAGNKEYGPNSCIFVSGEINNLMLDNAAARGDLPLGVHLDKCSGMYVSMCHAGGSQEYLGKFITVDEAEYTYCIFKSRLIKETSCQDESLLNTKIQSALLRHANLFYSKAMEIKSKTYLQNNLAVV